METWIVMLYVMIAFLAAAITTLVAAYAWRHREAAGARSFSVLMLLITFWSFTVAMGVLSPSEEVWRIWRNLEYIGIAGAPVAFLIFSLHYTGRRRRLARHHILVLCAMPVLTQVIIWTNAWHGLWFIETPPFRLGVWFWIHSAYSFGVVFIGMVLMSLAILRASALRRWQASVVLFSIALPLVINIFHTFDLISDELELTPIAFTVSGIAFAWTMYRHRLFDLTPLAREVLIDGMQDGMLVLNLQHQIIDYNPAVLALLGASAMDLDGTPVDRVFAAWPQLQPHLDTEIPIPKNTEIELLRAGRPRAYEVHITPIFDHQQALAGRLLLLHDITERKRYARELETRNAELDAFAHTVAHDLKTPLTSLVGFSKLLSQRARSWPPAKIEENAARILQMGYKMTNIVNELLLLASVRQMDEIETAPLAMDAIVAEALARFGDQIAAREVVVSTPEVWPEALGYAPWVEEVWVNYISNALKYGGDPPRITLGADEGVGMGVEGDAAIRFCRFWCRDNGPGLSKEAQAKLFAEFIRLEQTRAKGHGLGLSIVRRIVEKLGGEVGVESEVGAGSDFWFTLPRA
ncbi:MAG: sensor histidine kinase [Anaerolineales bacterium]